MRASPTHTYDLSAETHVISLGLNHVVQKWSTFNLHISEILEMQGWSENIQELDNLQKHNNYIAS